MIINMKKIKYFLKYKNNIKILILKSKWPFLNYEKIFNKKIILLQKKICYLSLVNNNKKAFNLIKKNIFNIYLRYLAINNIFFNINKLFKKISKKNIILIKLNILYYTKFSNFYKLNKLLKYKKNIALSTLINKTIQICYYILLDPYYEAKYTNNMYSFRKGRTSLNSIGFIKNILNNIDIRKLNILKLSGNLNLINEELINKYLKIPLLLKYLLLKSLKYNNKYNILNNIIIGPLICNVILMKIYLKNIKFKYNLNLSNYIFLYYNKNYVINELFYLCKTNKYRGINLLLNKIKNASNKFNNLRYSLLKIIKYKINYIKYKIKRYIIFYLNNIIIITTKINELNLLFNTINIKKQKIKIIIPNSPNIIINKINIEYLSFNIFYIPKIKNKIKNIHARNNKIKLIKCTTYKLYKNNINNINNINNKSILIKYKIINYNKYLNKLNYIKSTKILNSLIFFFCKKVIYTKTLFKPKINYYGFILIYPNKYIFKIIKYKIKNIIKKLIYINIKYVINKINPIIENFVYYYGWFNIYNRFKTLDKFIFFYFKKYLIRKYRLKGIKRIFWIIKKYIYINNNKLSPYKLKWHIHSEYISLLNKITHNNIEPFLGLGIKYYFIARNKKTMNDVLFVNMFTKIIKFVQIDNLNKLNKFVFYLNIQTYIEYYLKILKKRRWVKTKKIK